MWMILYLRLNRPCSSIAKKKEASMTRISSQKDMHLQEHVVNEVFKDDDSVFLGGHNYGNKSNRRTKV
jgi:hypothetical protein